MPHRILLASTLTLLACGDGGDPKPATSACQRALAPMRLVDYAPRPYDVLSFASRAGHLVAWVLHYSDPTGAALDDREGELFEVRWGADDTPVPSPPDAVAELVLPADASLGLVTRLTGAPFDAFEGPESAGRSLPLAPASFEVGLCVRGGVGDDWLDIHIDGPLEILAGDGQDVVRAAGAEVVVDAGPGHDTVLLAGAGSGHSLVDGGPGRDRLMSLGPDARLIGGDDDDCLATRVGVRASGDGGPGVDRGALGPDAGGVSLEQDAAESLQGYRWCGPTWVDGPEPSGVWDPFARDVEELVMDAIDHARAEGLACGAESLPPAPVGPRTGGDQAALRWAARMHARDTGGYPPPTSPRFAGDALVPESIILQYDRAHISLDGDDGYVRALRAGVDLGPPATRVFENVARCVNDQPGCRGTAAEVAHAIFEKWRLSPGHCRAMLAFPEAAGVTYAVGVFPQPESFLGTPLPSPHYNAVFLLAEHRAAAP